MLKIQSKNDYDTKTSDIESKYIITADYNKITKNIVDNSIKNRNLGNSGIAGFINSSDLDKKSNISDKNQIKSRTRQNNKITIT